MPALTKRHMRLACERAAAYYRQTQSITNVRLEVTIDVVPHLAPEIGRATDWYKVGSLYLAPQSRMLHVYLDPLSSAVKLEQDLIAVP